MSSSNDNIHIKKQRKFSLHHDLIGSARQALEKAESKKPGSYYYQLMCITMSSIAVEAMTNAFGHALVDNWEYHDRAPTLSKIVTVGNSLGLTVNFQEKPWSDVKWLHGLRNKIAHAKPENVEEIQSIPPKKILGDFSRPKSKLEKEITLGHAKRALAATVQLKDILSDRLNFESEKSEGLFNDSWYSSGVE